MILRIPMIIFMALTLSAAIAAEQSTHHHGGLHLSHGHARATAPGQSSAAVYLTITNSGSAADHLTKIDSPAAASADLHTMSMAGGMMKMRAVDGLVLAPAATVAMAPGDGYHIMLNGLRHPLVAGQTIPLTLTFKKTGVVKTVVTIDALTSTP